MKKRISIAFKSVNAQSLIGIILLLGFVFCTLIYWRHFGGIRMLAHDTIFFDFPWRQFLSDAVRSGIFPMWDPFNSPGLPLSYPSSPNYYPLALLTGLIKSYDEYSFLFEILITHFLAFLGMFLWLRLHGSNKLLSLAGAIGFSGCGPMVTSLQSYPVMVSMMFLPWFFLGIHLLVCSSRNWLRTRILGIVHLSWSSVMQLTGGYLVLILPMIIFGALYGIWGIWSSFKKIGQAAAGAFFSLILIFFILALPISEYVRLVHPYLASLRGLNSGFDPFNGVFPPASFLALFLPSGVYLPGIKVGRAEQMYMGIFLGMSFLLPFAGVPLKKKDFKGIAIALLAALVAMGSWNPLARFFVEYVPGIRWLRFHVFWGIITEFFLLTTAIVLWNRFLRMLRFSDGKEIIRRLLILISVIILILLGLSSLLTYQAGRKLVLTRYEYVEYIGTILAGIIASGIWFWISRKTVDKKSLNKLILRFVFCFFLVILFLIFCGHFLPQRITHSLVSIFSGTAVVQPISGGLSALATALDATKFPVTGWTILKMDGIHVVWIMIALTFILLNYRKGPSWMMASILVLVFLDLGVASQRYNYGNLYWIGKKPPEHIQHICYPENNREIGNEKMTPFFERTPHLGTYSRFYNPATVALSKSPPLEEFFFKIAWFFPEDLPQNIEDWWIKGNQEDIKSVKLCPNQISLQIDSGHKKGWVVITDSWAPGWKVSVNQLKETVLKVYGALKGVKIPEGQLTVVFSYQPVYLIPGLIFLALGLGILGVLAGWAWRLGRKNP